MRDGQITEADRNLLLECSTKNVLMDYFNDAIRLFFDKKSVAECNYHAKLLQNGQPVAQWRGGWVGREGHGLPQQWFQEGPRNASGAQKLPLGLG